MSTALSLRRGRLEDASACAAVVTGWVSATNWMPERFSHAEMTAMIEEVIPKREVYVIGRPVVGYVSFHPEANLIAGLYVARSGEGLGKALIDRVKMGRDYLQLWTHLPNTRAQAFYAREGFEKTGETRDGDDGQVELQMAWRRC